MHRNGFPIADLMKASLQATPKAATDYAAARTPHNHSIGLKPRRLKVRALELRQPSAVRSSGQIRSSASLNWQG
jgi:hypothetical protein